MRPYFDRKSGTVTIGNSCPVTDGASAFLVASPEAVKKYDLKPMARIMDWHFSALEPQRMGMGPLKAMHGILAKNKLKIDDIDLFEINEAFASVVEAWLIATGADWAQVNVNGGAIAVGHPLGASGAILLTRLVHEMARRGTRYGLQAMCEGGGTANATILELVG